MAVVRPVKFSCILASAMALSLVACGGSKPGPTSAEVTVCRDALIATRPSGRALLFTSNGTVAKAEASGGPTFGRLVKDWLASTGDGQVAAAQAVVHECDRIGGFPTS